MTFAYYPNNSVPYSALPQLPAGTIVGNNTSSAAQASAIAGFPAPTTVTVTGTISYTGIKTSVIVNDATANTQTLAVSPVIGSLVNIQNIGAGIVTVMPPAGFTINGQSSLTIPATAGAGIETNVTLRCDSASSFSVE